MQSPVLRVALLLIVLAAALIALRYGSLIPSRDLMALWLAAKAVAAGDPGSVYPPLSPLFEMRPPLAWFEQARDLGRPGEVYPYLYPPLWAWLLAPVTRWLDFGAVAAGAFLLNSLMLLTAPLVGLRLALGGQKAARGAGVALAFGLALLLLTRIGPVALLQGQPQIGVAFLVLLGLERDRNGHPLAGGAAMGLAIALKLSPLPLALIWLIAGRRRAFGAAAVTAGGLGLVSIALAGWAPHAQFLAELRAIDHTMLVSGVAYSLDVVVASLAFASELHLVTSLPPEITDPTIVAAFFAPETGWAILAKPAPYALAQRMIVIAVVLGAGLALRRLDDPARRAALWAAALIALAFFGPIGWAYYYIAPAALAPVLLLCLPRTGWIWLTVACALLAEPVSAALRASAPSLVPVANITGIGVLFLGCIVAACTPMRANSLSPLRGAPV